jgi:hypothetical protein
MLQGTSLDSALSRLGKWPCYYWISTR